MGLLSSKLGLAVAAGLGAGLQFDAAKRYAEEADERKNAHLKELQNERLEYQSKVQRVRQDEFNKRQTEKLDAGFKSLEQKMEIERQKIENERLRDQSRESIADSKRIANERRQALAIVQANPDINGNKERMSAISGLLSKSEDPLGGLSGILTEVDDRMVKIADINIKARARAKDEAKEKATFWNRDATDFADDGGIRGNFIERRSREIARDEMDRSGLSGVKAAKDKDVPPLPSTSNYIRKNEGSFTKARTDDDGGKIIGPSLHQKHPMANAWLKELGYDPAKVWSGEQSITDEHSDDLLQKGIVTAEKELRQRFPDFDKLDAKAKTALTDIMYQSGASNFDKRLGNVAAAIKAGDYAKAGEALRDSYLARSSNAGVAKRAERNAEILSGLTALTRAPEVDRSFDAFLRAARRNPANSKFTDDQIKAIYKQKYEKP